MLQHFTHKLIIASASLLAALSIIFAGYSAWTFTTDRREDINTGISITQAVLRGSFDTTEFPQMIVIEQNGVRFFLMDSLGPSYEKQFKPTYSYLDDIPIESMVFAIRVKVNSPFSEYFEVVVNEKDKLDPSEISGLPELSEGEYWIDLTGYLVPSKDDYKGDSKDDGWNHSVSFDMSTDFFNNLIVYKNGMNPKTKEQYDKLYQVVSETNAPFLFVELWQGTKNISKSVS